MNCIKTDVLIVGGGAAGLFCAIKIKEKFKDKKVLIIEQNKRVGKKLLLTGNGKCNLANLNVSEKSFMATDYSFISYILKAFPPKKIISEFEVLGLISKSDNEGRVYPYSENASSVLDVLRLALEKLDVDILTETKLTDFKKEGKSFFVKTNRQAVKTAKLIIACGGKSAPQTGSDGNIFPVLERSGIDIVPTFPALSPVQVKEQKMINSLKGVRAKALIRFFADDTKIDTKIGEIQFRQDAISGICVFDLAKYAGEYSLYKTVLKKPVKNISLKINFFPDKSEQYLHKLFCKRIDDYPCLPLDILFTAFINKSVAQAVIKNCSLKPSQKAETLDNSVLNRLIYEFKNFTLTPTRPLLFNNSQATAGGINLNELNFESLEIKKYSGLYAVGEILDVLGDCGGYNLYFAWASAALCAENLFK